MKHGVCVRALGDLTMLPEELQRSVARVVKYSQNNTKYVGAMFINLYHAHNGHGKN